jgi:hypothetical protein
VLAWRSPAHVSLVELLVDQILRSFNGAAGLLWGLALLEILA